MVCVTVRGCQVDSLCDILQPLPASHPLTTEGRTSEAVAKCATVLRHIQQEDCLTFKTLLQDDPDTSVRKCARLQISSPSCRGLTDVQVTAFLLAITPPLILPTAVDRVGQVTR